MKQIVILSHARKSYNSRVVLDDVTLAFRLGAKIGVVGPNGTGKSTLLWMMAGVEQPSNGEARLMPGYTVGLLTQEPELDETRTVLGNVEEGVAGTRALVERFHEVAAKLAADCSDELLDEMGRAAGATGSAGGVGPGPPGRAGDGRAALPAAGCGRERAVGRRAAPGGAVPAVVVPAGPAAGRADQPSGRGERRLAGAAPGQVPRYGGGGHSRPVLPGQRRGLDPGTGPRPRLPVRGKLLDLPGDQGRPDDGRRAAERQAATAARRGAGVGAVQPARPPGQEPRPAGRVRAVGRRGRVPDQAGLRADPDPARPAAGPAWWSRPAILPRGSAAGC
jgi:energy-coupling factor transporter ATP-binding protein EcfA2